MKHTRQVVATIILMWLFSGTSALAAVDSSEAKSIGNAGTDGLGLVDWAIIAAYGAGTLLLGWHYGRKQSTTKEYFVGSGGMNPLLIGVSLFATLLSTISYLSMPGESLGKGPVIMISSFAMPIVFIIVGFVVLPVYMRQKVTSAYELLEDKLGVSIRLLGASMFIVLRLVWMSLLIHLTAEALTIMIGIPEAEKAKWIPLIAIATGIVAVTYTSLGGLRAVVITDAIQTVLLYAGALLVLGVVSYDFGGFGWVPTSWNPTWDTQPFFSWDPSTRLTVVGTLTSYVVWYVCTSAGDQTSVQRFMATSDAPAARRALATQLCVSIIVSVTLALVGFALLAYFTAHQEQLPQDQFSRKKLVEVASQGEPGVVITDDVIAEARRSQMKSKADKLFPHFIANLLPPGIAGLVVAAMFAAAMSSIDSGVNSISAVVMTDVMDRFGHAPKSKEDHVRMARWLAFGIGAFVVFLSSFMGLVPGNITAMTNKTSNLLTTPIFGLFFFALFIPFASTRGVWVGAICGTLTAAGIAFSGPLVLGLHLWFGCDPVTFGTTLVETLDSETQETILSCPDPISFQYIAPVAVLVNIVTGCVASKLMPQAEPPSPSEV